MRCCKVFVLLSSSRVASCNGLYFFNLSAPEYYGVFSMLVEEDKQNLSLTGQEEFLIEEWISSARIGYSKRLSPLAEAVMAVRTSSPCDIRGRGGCAPARVRDLEGLPRFIRAILPSWQATGGEGCSRMRTAMKCGAGINESLSVLTGREFPFVDWICRRRIGYECLAANRC